MINLNLNFHQRVGLWLRIGSAQVASLKDASILIRLIEKIRPKEHELKEVGFKQNEGRIEYVLKDLNYGIMTGEIEDDEAQKLIECLNTHSQPFRIDEAAWMLALIEDMEEQLNGNPVSK